MYIYAKSQILGNDGRDYLRANRRNFFEILASNNYEYMKKFDFKTITPEEWKAWIYGYHPDPEELKKDEEEGYFI